MRSLLWRLPDRWLAPAPDRARVAWLSTGPYAHRGLHDGATPENSSAAFAAAVARGLGVECDVRLTGDGRAVVFHDERLDRLTGSKGAVADHDWDRLKSLTLRDGGTIPLLRDLLDQVAGKAPLLIELKARRDRPAAPLCAAVRADLAGYAGQHAVMSFDSRVARWFSRHSPETLRGLVMTEEGARGRRHSAERHLSLWRARPDFLAYDIRDLPSCFASAQRQRGLPVLAWTVRTADCAGGQISTPMQPSPRRKGSHIPAAIPRFATMADQTLTVRIAPGVSSLPAGGWNALAGADNPFVCHEFLSALEDSGSVGPGTGWSAAPIVVADGSDNLLAAMPNYVKGHSQGEYVFDHAWADAWERAGGAYYPKLQIAVPFTPATGPRLLLSDPAYAPVLLQAAERICRDQNFSSAHATFVERDQLPLFESAGWLRRADIQFHWDNAGYSDFEDFLGALSSRKRKDIRKERAAAREGLTIRALSGDAIRPEHWDAFWEFYQDTGARKWGTPYLTRAAFDLLGDRMADRIVLILAFDGARPIAGALNFVGRQALYGRYWGCVEDRRFLHFELCYYQAIDIAIARGLKRVEAGAQGGHKLARGYEPVETHSMHYIADSNFRQAVTDYLDQERQGVALDRMVLGQRVPFRRGN